MIRKLPITCAVPSLLGLAALGVSAEDAHARGAAIYARPSLCITCHQANGAGIPGAFPPLAGSEWVTGDPSNLIRIVDRGIEGEIGVNGKMFNAVMPAQGGQLSDKEMADLLTYVRSAWGNKASPVSVKEIAQQKKTDKDRGEKPWNALELKSQAQVMSMDNPKVKVYGGSWVEIPDLAKLPEPQQTVAGVLAAKLAPKSGGLLIAEGTLACKEGEAAITLRANGPTQAWVDDTLVVHTPSLISGDDLPRVDQINTVKLTAGNHRFRVIHLVTAEVPMKCSAAVNLPGVAKPIPLTEGNADAIERGESDLDLQPSVTKVTATYRGFFAQTSTRSIAVGFPEKLSLMFDTVNDTWSIAWRGAFISGRHHWSGRGMGYAEWPLGDQIAFLPAEPPFAILANSADAWPAKHDIDTWPDGYKFLGYDLDKEQRPTFSYRFNTLTITDRPEPQADGKTLRRHLRLTTATPPAGLTYRAIAGRNLETIDPTTFRLGKRLTIHLDLPRGTTAKVRTKDGFAEVLVPVSFTGDHADIAQDYRWEEAP
jgi:mono/diheme cytochrome c family protein